MASHLSRATATAISSRRSRSQCFTLGAAAPPGPHAIQAATTTTMLFETKMAETNVHQAMVSIAHKQSPAGARESCMFYTFSLPSMRFSNVVARSKSRAKWFNNSAGVAPICSAKWRMTLRKATVSSSARWAWPTAQRQQARRSHRPGAWAWPSKRGHRRC